MNEVQTTVKSEICQFVIFQLGSEYFCIDLLSVREIIRLTGITKIPESPPFVEGVITIRGEIVPVIDLRKRFDFKVEETGHKDNRIMIVEADNHIIGFIVDAVREVLRIELSEIKPAPALVTSEIDKRYIQGVITSDEKLLIVLNANLIFAQEELYSIDKIEVA